MEPLFIATPTLVLGFVIGYALGRRNNKLENPINLELAMKMGPHMTFLWDLYDAVLSANLGLEESQMHRMFFRYLTDELAQDVSQDTAIEIYNILKLMDDPTAREMKLNNCYLQDRVLPTIKHVVKPFLEEKRPYEPA